jgi:hypothetical protein
MDEFAKKLASIRMEHGLRSCETSYKLRFYSLLRYQNQLM